MLAKLRDYVYTTALLLAIGKVGIQGASYHVLLIAPNKASLVK